MRHSIALLLRDRPRRKHFAAATHMAAAHSRTAFIVAVVAIGAAAWYTFRPARLFIDTTVNESLAAEIAGPAPATAMATAMATAPTRNAASRGYQMGCAPECLRPALPPCWSSLRRDRATPAGRQVKWYEGTATCASSP